jgi:voltage-gated potassium channel
MSTPDNRAVEWVWARPVWSLVGLLVAYYAFPAELGASIVTEVVSLVLTAAGLALLLTMMVRELKRVRQGEDGIGGPALAMLLVLLVMSFAMAFFLVEAVDPDQFTGLETRTDALYFTLTTMATVGFGDVHAAGQFARGLVSFFIVFNIVVVASLARLYTSRK